MSQMVQSATPTPRQRLRLSVRCVQGATNLPAKSIVTPAFPLLSGPFLALELGFSDGDGCPDRDFLFQHTTSSALLDVSILVRQRSRFLLQCNQCTRLTQSRPCSAVLPPSHVTYQCCTFSHAATCNKLVFPHSLRIARSQLTSQN